MKNLADLKRRFLPGATLEMTYHADEKVAARLVGVHRTLTAVKSRDIVFAAHPASRDQVSYLPIPRASEVRIDGPDAFTLTRDGAPFISYRFIRATLPEGQSV